MKRFMSPRMMLVISMTVFGTLGLFVRNISVSSGELALYRAILAALLIAVFLSVTKQKIPFGEIKREVPLLLLSGVAMGFNWILLFEAYKYTTVSAATLSYYFAPIIVTASCPVLFKEKMSAKQWICFFYVHPWYCADHGPRGAGGEKQSSAGHCFWRLCEK